MKGKDSYFDEYYRLGGKDARSNTKKGKSTGHYPLYSTLVAAGQYDLARAYARGWYDATGLDLTGWHDLKS